MKRKTILICLSLLFTITGFAIAKNHGGPFSEKHCLMEERMRSNLDLSSEQTEKIKALKDSLKNEMAPLRLQENRYRAELKLLWMQENPDLDKIKTKQKEMHDLGWQIMGKTTDHCMAFRKILTPEQLTQFLAKTCDRPFGPPGKGPGCPGGKMRMDGNPGFH